MFYAERKGYTAKFGTDSKARNLVFKTELRDHYAKEKRSKLSLATTEKEADSARRAAIERNKYGIFPKQGKSARVDPTGKTAPTRDLNETNAVKAYLYQKSQNVLNLNLDCLVQDGKLISEYAFKKLVKKMNDAGGVKYYSLGKRKGQERDTINAIQSYEDSKSELKAMEKRLTRTIELTENPIDSDIYLAAMEYVPVLRHEILPAMRRKVKRSKALIDKSDTGQVTLCRQIVGKRHALVTCFDALHRAKRFKQSRVTERNLKDSTLRKLCNRLIVSHNMAQYLTDSYKEDERKAILKERALERATILKDEYCEDEHGSHDSASLDYSDYMNRVELIDGKLVQIVNPDTQYQEHLDSLPHDPLPRAFNANTKPMEDNGRSKGKLVLKDRNVVGRFSHR